MILGQEDPDKNYIHSSPLGQQFGNDDGDVHYWAVWWGGAEIDAYDIRVGLFNSEFGM